MASSILATKLFIPPPRPEMVRRPRLTERLNDVLRRKLTLISAPAGFGKTTLIAEWVAACAQRDPKVRAAWLSLDEGDGDLTRFLTYLIAALQTIAPDVGADLLSLLQSAQMPPLDSMLTALVNEVSSISEPFVLVLDDYHRVDARPVDEALTFLVEHLPPHMHLILTTREDPTLPLARLRARGQLTEVRARDLRFGPAEAAEFLNQGMALDLSADEISALEERTEGWIAGLQLAALSLQGNQNVPGFIQTFAGDHRYIVDYLVEEVLERQPEPVRRFLLQTAMLDRFSAPLCDAVTGQLDGSEFLKALERGNFFVVPLDDKRQWYRYHHLFAEVLSTHLTAEQPELVPVLHRRASVWYEQNELLPEAIHHALVAQDFHRAAILIERALPMARRSRQEAMLLGWLKALPDELLRVRPVLGVQYVGTLMQMGQFDGVEVRLRDAERWLDTSPDRAERPDIAPADLAVDQEELRLLPGSVAMYRTAIALSQGNVTETMRHARHGLELVREDDYLPRGALVTLLALAYWTGGDLAAARQWYPEGMTSLQRAGYFSDVVGCSIALADIQLELGHLREAKSTCERGLQLVTQAGSVLRGAADMHVGLSRIAYEFNDLSAASDHLQKSNDLGEFLGLPQNRYRWRVAQARILAAGGDWDGALDLLEEAERVYTGDFSPNVRPIAALKARAWIAQGRLAEAAGWVHERGLSADDNLNYLREFEHITLARVLMAQAASDPTGSAMREAVSLLERLFTAAETGGRTGNVIEILLLQALAYRTQANVPAALAVLERALTLAEPEGYVRRFVDEGSPLAALLEAAAKQGIARNYVRELLSAFGTTEHRTPAQQALTDPLSERELDVLRLLATDLNGPDMARELMVSLNTLRTHTKNIYSKLGVNDRQTAVRRADELNLL